MGLILAVRTTYLNVVVGTILDSHAEPKSRAETILDFRRQVRRSHLDSFSRLCVCLCKTQETGIVSIPGENDEHILLLLYVP